MRIDLPDDQWAEVMDPEELDDGVRKTVVKAVQIQYDRDSKLPIYPASMEDDVYDALLKAVLVNWSFTAFPLPKDDPASLNKLKIRTARTLRKALQPHMDLINGAERGEDPTPGSES